MLHEAFYVAPSGRPGPVVVDIPKDVQFATGGYFRPNEFQHKGYQPRLKGDIEKIKQAVEMMADAKRPVFYTGGGVINSGPEASRLLRELVELTGFPDHLDPDGARRVPGRRSAMAGHAGHARHLRSQHAMHDCDLMICIGARFDDRITGRLDAFSPGSKKIHIDIDRVLDQQERAGRYAHHRRLRAMCSRTWCGLWRRPAAQVRQERAEGLVGADRPLARRARASPIGIPTS